MHVNPSGSINSRSTVFCYVAEDKKTWYPFSSSSKAHGVITLRLILEQHSNVIFSQLFKIESDRLEMNKRVV